MVLALGIFNEENFPLQWTIIQSTGLGIGLINGFLINQAGVSTKASKVHIWSSERQVWRPSDEAGSIQVMVP
jgi:hypothetical protein